MSAWHLKWTWWNVASAHSHCNLPVNVSSSAREASKPISSDGNLTNETTTTVAWTLQLLPWWVATRKVQMSTFYISFNCLFSMGPLHICQISPLCNSWVEIWNVTYIKFIVLPEVAWVTTSPLLHKLKNHHCERNIATRPICHRYFRSMTDINVCEALTPIITMCYVLKMRRLMPHGCSQHFINHI